MNTIDFKGVSSTSIDGLLICELPPISKPPMRVLETSVDGRHGTIIDELGYMAYDKTVHIGLRGTYDINKVIKFFSGEGDIVFSNEPDKVYRGRVIGQVDYTRLVRFKQANVTFRVQPFKHKNREAFVEAIHERASSPILFLNDCYKITSFVVDGASGTLNVVGKNLFDVKTFLKNNNGFTNVLNADGSITTIGVPTVDYENIAYCELDNLLVSGRSYTIWQKYASNKIYAQLNVKDKETNVTTPIIANSLKKTFVVDKEKYSYMAVVQATSKSGFGTEAVSFTNFYQIEEGTVATEFEPHSKVTCEYIGKQEQADIFVNINLPSKLTIYNNNNSTKTVEYFKLFEVFNEGLEVSKPMIVLRGSGTVEMKVNGMAVFTYTFPDGEDEVVLDCEAEEAYLGAVLKNRNMLGEFPELQPKTNKVEWSGDVKSVQILPRSRWL